MNKLDPRLEQIQTLANTRFGRKEFCERFLESISRLTNAQAGAIWDGKQPFELVCQHAEQGPVKIGLTKEAHNNLLEQGLNQPQPLVLRAAEKADGMPSILLGKFDRFGKHIVELFVDPQEGESEKQVLEFFGAALQFANNAPKDPDRLQAPPAEAQDTSLDPAEVSNFLAAIHKSIDRKSTCNNVVNETRRFLDCDRATVLLWHQGKFRIFSISGQVSVNRRSNAVRNLEKLASRITKTGETFWYPEETEIPPQISGPLDIYLNESATRSLIVKPIFAKELEAVEDPDSLESKNNKVIGSLVLEHCNEQWARETMEPKVEFVARHVGNAVRNANNHSNLFLYSIWKWLGKSRLLAAPRLLPKVVLVLASLLVLTAALLFWQVDFYVSADGVLVPKNRANIFAPRDAIVAEIFETQGNQVQEGAKLLQLTSPEFDLQYKTAEGELANLETSLEILQNQRFDRNDEEKRAEIGNNISTLRERIVNAKNKLDELEKTRTSMLLTSPISGTVITWDVDHRLRDRPVSPTQVLMEVADTEGEWELEVDLADRRVGHLLRALEDSPEGVEVTYLLAADTSERGEGTVSAHSLSTMLNGDNKQIVRVLVDIADQEKLDINQARTGVQVKMMCGKCSLGYLWFHDIKEFLDKNVWFYVQ